MRVLQVAPRYPPQTGGVETHVREISERLVERGHAVTVLTADADGDGRPRESIDGVAVRRYRGLSPDDSFHVAPGVIRGVRKRDADIVHAHNYHSLPLLFAAVGTNDERFVVTTHYHGGSASSIRERLLRLYNPLGKWAVRNADEVIAVSGWEREKLRTDFDVDAAIIPNGLDIDRFSDAEPEERDRPYLLCVGRLVEYKGVQHAVRVLTDLPGYELVVAGDGPHLKSLRNLAIEHGIDDRVTFLGHVAHERLPHLYAGASVFLNLSTREAYGMTVAEALAAGTPCVVREAGGLVDWTDVQGTVGVSAVSKDDLVTAVHEATTVRPAAVLSTWDEVCDDLVELYASDCPC